MTKFISNFILLPKANQKATHNSKADRKYNPVMCPGDPGNIWYTTVMTIMMANFQTWKGFRCWATPVQGKCPLETVLFTSFLYIATHSLAQ